MINNEFGPAVPDAALNWQRTFDAINDVIWILDAEQRILHANQATKRVFGRSAGEVIGRHCYEIVHGTTESIEDCPLQRSRKSLRREKMELKLGEKIFEVIVDPIMDKNGGYFISLFEAI